MACSFLLWEIKWVEDSHQPAYPLWAVWAALTLTTNLGGFDGPYGPESLKYHFDHNRKSLLTSGLKLNHKCQWDFLWDSYINEYVTLPI